ncbi:MAG: hypothetical protein WB757_12030 [Candidatus Cybelea sp.]|jgi:hypothetical protein
MYAPRHSIAALIAAIVLVTLMPASAAPNAVASGSFAGCPAHGSGGDPQVNTLKNRSTAPVSANPITVAAMKQLPLLPDGTPAMRANWPQSARATIEPHEAQGAVFTGYILQVARETGEPSNCGSTQPRDEDIELFLAHRPGVTNGQQIILGEITPRWRAAYTSWRPANLRGVAGGNRIRITGWLLYDQESFGETHGGTATPWEIEPITKVELLRNGSWVNL